MDSDKKAILIGCLLGTGLFVLIVAGIIGYFVYVGYQVANTFSGMTAGFEKMSEVEAKYPFTAPGDYTINANRLDQYMDMREKLLARIDETKYFENLQKQNRAIYSDDPQSEDVGAVFDAIGSMFAHIELFAEILEGGQMSASEFEYYTVMVLATMRQAKDTNDGKFASGWDRTMTAVNDLEKNLAIMPEMQGEIVVEIEENIPEISAAMADPTYQAIMSRFGDGRITPGNLAKEIVFLNEIEYGFTYQFTPNYAGDFAFDEAEY